MLSYDYCFCAVAGVVESFIADLKAKIPQGEGTMDVDDDDDLPDLEEAAAGTSPPEADPVDYPPVYESGEDYDRAGDEKQAASDRKDAGDWEGALGHYSAAVVAAPPSALLYANRAHALMMLGRFKEAERDCDLALKENPDSSKALRVRGKVRKELGDYERALADLSLSQTIDFDEGTVEDLKFLTEKHLEKEKTDAEARIEHEEKLRKRAEEIKKAQEEAKSETSRASGAGGGGFGGMPGGGGGGGGFGGMPGGMGGGIPGMEGLMGEMMNDPELVAAMQKPKVQAALASLMGGGGANPAKMMELMRCVDVAYLCLNRKGYYLCSTLNIPFFFRSTNQRSRGWTGPAKVHVQDRGRNGRRCWHAWWRGVSGRFRRRRRCRRRR
jgi:suppressor of tumorigenicity protein 13